MSLHAGNAFQQIPEVVHSLTDLNAALIVVLQLYTAHSGGQLVHSLLVIH